jgi:hypothetical protein
MEYLLNLKISWVFKWLSALDMANLMFVWVSKVLPTAVGGGILVLCEVKINPVSNT